MIIATGIVVAILIASSQILIKNFFITFEIIIKNKFILNHVKSINLYRPIHDVWSMAKILMHVFTSNYYYQFSTHAHM